MLNNRKKLKFLLPIIAILGVFVISGFVFAQADPIGIEDVGFAEVEAGLGLGAQDIRITIARIIRTALGLLGIVAVVIVIAGGVVWMTAGGDAGKVDTAKKLMINGAIGLAIILSAFGIAHFVLNSLIEATRRAEGIGPIGPGGGPGGGFGPAAFTLRGITPSGAIPIRNVTVRATFNAGVDGETVAGNFIVTRAVDGAVVDGTLVTARNTIEFTPTADCPEPHEDRKCFEADTEFRVRLSDGIRSQAGRPVVCGGFAPVCEGVFVTGSLIDVEGPEVEVTVPDPGESVSVDALVALEALAEDDAGVSQIEFFIDDAFVDADAPLGETPREYTGEVVWDTAGVVLGRHNVTARASDIDANSTMSRAVSIHVRAAHCFNAVRDADEGGVDCGGEDCAACDGGPCVEDADCAAGVCRVGVCVSVPRIDGVSPGDGREGNYITISGAFFGVEEGQIVFLGAEGDDDDQVAPLADCATAWQNDQVIVEVPVDAQDGPIQLIAASDESDTTDNERGALIDDFDVNEFLRPGICEVRPVSGVIGDALDIVGVQFGDAEGVNQALLSGRSILPDDWSNELISGTVPNVARGRQPVQVIVDGEVSNPVNFRVVSPEAGTVPSITYIDPVNGPRENYITIYGENFGRGMGTVIFRNSATGDDATALVNFPAACGDDFWHDDSITVKVPIEYAGEIDVLDGLHTIRVRRADGVESAGAEFSIEEGAAGPGICRINPNNGPAIIPVTVSGERFGGDAGGLTFWNDVDAAIGGWRDQEILATVPRDAETGPVRVVVGEQQSNGVNFRVSDCNESGCGEGEECCDTGVCIPEGEECVGGPRAGGFAWRFSTGIIPFVPRVVEECREGASPSPSPWNARRGGNEVCVNAAINVRFTMEMDEETLNADNIGAYRCVAEDEENPCAEIAPIRGRIETFEDGFQFLPIGGLEPATRYYVNLTADIRGEGEFGDFMLEDADSCGVGNAYCFGFGTRAGDDPCAVGGVVTNPSNTTIVVQGGTKNYMASAISRGDICIALDPDAYDWSWYVREEDGDRTACAAVTNVDRVGGGEDGDEADGHTDASQVARGDCETIPDPPLHVWADIPEEGVRDDGQLIINFVDPEIISAWPMCTAACINSEIGVEFNTSIDVATLEMPGNFIVYECSNESCRRFEREIEGEIDYTEEDKVAVFNDAELEERTYYRVVIRGGVEGVRSGSGALLAGTNYGEMERDYSWIFRTRDSDLPCEISSVDLRPRRRVLNYIGQTQTYNTAPLGAPDECSERGQRLTATEYDWAWASTERDVARFIRNRGDLLDVLPREGLIGCNNMCLHTGTRSGIFVCGNGGEPEFDEDTGAGEDCDDGNIVDDDGCSSICLNEGSVLAGPVSTCGNARQEGGEDCDDGNVDNGDGCSEICLNEGAELGDSVCGNGDIGDGEDCDDGNTRDGDGCSRECLNEGSLTGPIPICGNDRREDGEDCDDGNTNVGDGCSGICLNEGTSRCLVIEAGLNCCGNGGAPERGEDCDDGNTEDGDGCSSRCLLEGSNLNYNSICGNAAFEGDLEIGEECDFPNPPSGDRRTDPKQYVEAMFGGETLIRATANEITGEGNLEVACVCERDSQCVGERFEEDGLGCGINGCCASRPTIESMAPIGFDICRNTVATIQFSEIMDIASLTDNIKVDRVRFLGADCPAGSVPSGDGLWCNDALSGTISTTNEDERTIARFIPSQAFDSRTTYRVRILGDSNLEDDIREGVRNVHGVTMGPIDPRIPFGAAFAFMTGEDICTLDEIEITPDPLYFLQIDDKDVSASAYTRIGDGRQELAPIPGVYDWTWEWGIGNTDLVNIVAGREGSENQEVSLAPRSPNRGETNVFATAEITSDTVSRISTVGREVDSDAEVIVLICENPWPTRGADGSWSPYFEGATNFSFYYCRDAGVEHDTRDDLPSIVEPVGVHAPPLADILTEFIIPVNCEEGSVTCGRGDAMGIRVMMNSDHHSPRKWYEMNGFTGAPAEVFIDDYPALQDGRTVYVNAANAVEAPDGLHSLYTNIYIISFTQDAGADTMEIYGQILENIKFTTTIDGFYEKEGLRRDVLRLASVRDMEEVLGNYGRLRRFCSVTQTLVCSADDDCPGEETCSHLYPKLDSGSFLPHFTNSVWPSWQIALGSELGFGMPQDPLNQFSTTERSELIDGRPEECVRPDEEDDNRCYKVGCSDPFNNQTCYNADQRLFICPNNSFVYSYENCLGNNYNLSFGLEYSDGHWVIDRLFDGEYNLTATSCMGEVWNSETICRAERGEPGVVAAVPPSCGNNIIEVDVGEVCDDGSLNGDYNHCNASCSGWGAYCGDGDARGRINVQGPPYGVEVCDLGDLNGVYDSECSWDCRSPRGPYCGDGMVQEVEEECEVGQTEMSVEGCEPTVEGYRTKKTRRCIAPELEERCTWPDWDTIECMPAESCGNSIVDGREECDDGNRGDESNNDGCTDECKNAFCGDGFTRRDFEQCDLGGENGRVCTPGRGLMCTYCSEMCTLLTISGE